MLEFFENFGRAKVFPLPPFISIAIPCGQSEISQIGQFFDQWLVNGITFLRVINLQTEENLLQLSAEVRQTIEEVPTRG